jgi:hypothetical protein
MLEITSDDIASLNDEDFRTLVGLLCEAELLLLGHSNKAATWGGNQNARDGGIDVRVRLDAGASITGFLSRASTGIQAKKNNFRPHERLLGSSPAGSADTEDMRRHNHGRLCGALTVDGPPLRAPAGLVLTGGSGRDAVTPSSQTRIGVLRRSEGSSHGDWG